MKNTWTTKAKDRDKIYWHFEGCDKNGQIIFAPSCVEVLGMNVLPMPLNGNYIDLRIEDIPFKRYRRLEKHFNYGKLKCYDCFGDLLERISIIDSSIKTVRSRQKTMPTLASPQAIFSADMKIQGKVFIEFKRNKIHA